MKRVHVLVVGAGPSGLVVAGEVAAAGGEVRVLERRESGVQSRAGTVLPRVLELLDSRGIAQEFIAEARQIREDPLIPFHIWAGLQPVWWRYLNSAFGHRLVLPQNKTEELLRRRAEGLGADVLYGRTVVGVEQSEGGVVVTVELPDGTTEQHEADYVVGADGGRSAVRKLSHMAFPGHDGTFTGIIADVRINMHWPEGRAMVDNEHGWAASFPFAENGEVTRFNMVHAQRRTAPRDEPISAEEVRGVLRDIFDRDIPFTELIWASRFNDAMRAVEDLRSDRVLLVGESARIHYPASGVGMNFCIQDGFNLGWKLALVVLGHAPGSILDSYSKERLPVLRDLLESVQAQTALQFNFTAEGIALKRLIARDLLPIPEVARTIGLQLNGLTRAYPATGEAHSLLGRPAPEATLQTRDGLVRLAELLHDGCFVLVDLTGATTFRRVELPRLVVESGPVVTSPEAFVGVTALLLRPDGYVHWVSTEATPSVDDARTALADWYTRVETSPAH